MDQSTSQKAASHHGNDGSATVRVLLFAAIRDAAGTDHVMLNAATVADVAAQLQKRFPAIQQLIERSRFAVNQAFAPLSEKIGPDDEIAIIPPVSGG